MILRTRWVAESKVKVPTTVAEIAKNRTMPTSLRMDSGYSPDCLTPARRKISKNELIHAIQMLMAIQATARARPSRWRSTPILSL